MLVQRRCEACGGCRKRHSHPIRSVYSCCGPPALPQHQLTMRDQSGEAPTAGRPPINQSATGLTKRRRKITLNSAVSFDDAGLFWKQSTVVHSGAQAQQQFKGTTSKQAGNTGTLTAKGTERWQQRVMFKSLLKRMWAGKQRKSECSKFLVNPHKIFSIFRH